MARVGHRFARWLLRLHPRRFRSRYGAEVEAALRHAVSEGEPPARLILDVAGTLVRSWRDEVRRRAGGGTVRSSVPGGISRELRYAARSLWRDPVHGVVAVATLAVAIGANAAVFSVTYAVLLRTLPYDALDRTVRVEPAPIRITSNDGYAVSQTLADLPQVEAASAFTMGGAGSLSSESGAEPVRVTHVDGRFFEVLGARLRMGRAPTVGAGVPEVVLGYGLWQRAFGGDEGVVGRTVQLSGHGVRVAGVAAPEVDYPDGTELWLSYPVMFDLMGPASGADVIARVTRPDLLPEVRELHESRERARWESRRETLPDDRRPELIPLRRSLIGPVGDSLVLLFGASALVLLLGCANLAGLILARNAGRRAEFAMRRALGAGRARLVGMIMTESVVIAAAAGVLAVAFAVWGRTLLVSLLPARLPGLSGGTPGAETLAFVAVLAVLASLLVGAIPAVSVWLETGAPGAAAGRLSERRRRLQPSLVIAQIALAVVLVISAGLLGRSVLSLRVVPLGYDTDGVWTFEARLPWQEEGWVDDRFGGFATAVVSRLVEQPGVSDVGVASRLPLSEGLGAGFRIWPAAAEEERTMMTAGTFHASSSYFDAIGIDFIAGTPFEAGAGAASAIVVSRGVAQALFGRTNVVGEQVRTRYSMREAPTVHTIAGVVEDPRPRGFLSDPSPSMYLPFDAAPVPSMAFAVRTNRDAADVTAMVRQAVREADPAVAPFAIRSMRNAADQAIAERDALAIVSGLFGAAALLLAVLGIYGLVAHSVVRRRREMGVRIAVGARAADLLAIVMGGTIGLASIGVAAGIFASLAATRLLSDFLFGVGTTDPPTFAAVGGIVLIAAGAAALVPAVRAARTDAIASLRAE